MSEDDYNQAAAQAYARLIEGVALVLILLTMLIGSLFYLATRPAPNQPKRGETPAVSRGQNK